MGRQIKRLSDRAIKAAKQPGYYCDGDGLYLQVSPAQTKSWIFRYTRQGRAREMGLGPERVISLADARGKATDARRLLVDGIDPIDTRDALRVQERAKSANIITFAQCATRYVATHRAGWRNPKHAAQWESTIEAYANPILGPLPVQGVDTARVLEVLEPIWTEKHETASRLRGRIEHVLDWAKVRGYRDGENPARWKGHLQKLLAKVKRKDRVQHHAALPYDKIGAFIVDLREQPGTAAQALEFTILTAGRTGEVIGAKPGEIDFQKGTWTIPGERMKAGREHRVPLSPRALEIAKAQPQGEYLFAGGKEGGLSNMAMLKVLERMERDELTVHGFRSTFRDWAAECTNYPNELCEMALAHVVSDETEAAYRRGDLFEKRRRLMADWAKYCETTKRVGDVVPMKRKKVS